MNTPNNSSNLIIPKKWDEKNKSQELLESLKSISDKDIQEMAEEIDLKDDVKETVEPNKAEENGWNLDVWNNGQQYLENYRKSWIDNIYWISDKSKSMIISKSKTIPLEIDIDNYDGKLIKFKIWYKTYKIFEPNWAKHLDDQFIKNSKRNLITNKERDYIDYDGIRKMQSAIREEIWVYENLRKYVFRKERELSMYMPNEDDIKDLLWELWKHADLRNESDQIAMLMYLTWMEWCYWTWTKNILNCHNDDRNISSEYYRHGFASIFMFSNWNR